MSLVDALTTPSAWVKIGDGLDGSTRGYAVWRSAKKRCEDSSDPDYPGWGGRGIYMCEEWRQSAKKFLDDMGEPGLHMSLGRIDNDGPYSLENCRWETSKEQASNRRSTRLLTAFGKTQTMSQWAREVGIKDSTIHNRIDNMGWDVETALSTPGLRKKSNWKGNNFRPKKDQASDE